MIILSAHMSIDAAPNHYIDNFQRPNKTQLTSLAQIGQDLAFERTSWEQSGAAEQTGALLINFYQKWGIVRKTSLHPAEVQNVVDVQRATMFGESVAGKAANLVVSQGFSSLPKNARSQFSDLIDTIESHATAFQEAIKPLRDDQERIFKDLLTSWRIYITSGLTHIGAFSQFLNDSQYSALRDEQRDFLVLLESQRQKEQRRGAVDLIESVKKETVENIVTTPTVEPLNAFVADLAGTVNPSGKGGNSDLLSWLRFASYPTEEVDTAKLLEIIQHGQFPVPFRNSLMGFLDRYIGRDATLARTALASYKLDKGPSFKMDLSRTVQPRKRGAGVISVTKETTTTEKPRIGYLLDIGGIPIAVSENSLNNGEQSLSEAVNDDRNEVEEAITAYVEKEVRPARTNNALKKDLISMVAIIGSDPHVVGVRRLSASHFLYFSPHKNPTFPTTDPETDRYRMVFEVLRGEKDNPNTRRVVIRDLLHHSDFDRKY